MEQQQGPEKKAIVAILLCVAVWAVWMQMNTNKQKAWREAQRANATPTPIAGTMTSGTNGAVALAPATTGTGGNIAAAGTQAGGASWPVVTAKLSNKVLDLELSTKGARPVAADLKQYKATIKAGQDASLVHLVTETINGSNAVYPMVPWFGTAQNSVIPADAVFEQVSATDDEVVYRWASAEGLQLTRTYRTEEDGYLVLVTEELKNVGAKSFTGRPGVVWATNFKGVKSSFFTPGDTEFTAAAGVNDRAQAKNAKKPGEDRVYGGLVDWVGITDRYFAAAVVPIEPRIDARDAVRFFKPGTKSTAAMALHPETTLDPGASRTYAYKLYLGPKDYTLLLKAGHNLDRAMDWGMFKPISKGLWHLLRWFQSWTRNWGLAIIVLTVIIRGLLSPLAAKQMRSANEFAAKSLKLKPALDKLREKHKDDPMTMNRETMLLYKQHGLSPFSPLVGCLPILIQMPIWFALYKVLYNSIDLRQAPFALWIQDLAAPDPWKVLPVLLGAVTFIQMKLTPNTGMDPAQARMMLYTMPLVFTLPMMGLPSGLVLYIFTSTLMNITQQWYLRRIIPPSGTSAVPAQGGAT